MIYLIFAGPVVEPKEKKKELTYQEMLEKKYEEKMRQERNNNS